jgi:hypothetical protein
MSPEYDAFEYLRMSAEEVAAAKQETYGTALYRAVARAMDYPISTKAMSEQYGEGSYELSQVLEENGFPYSLVPYKRTPPAGLLNQLLAKPEATSIFRTYMDAYRSNASNNEVALVFPCPGFDKFTVLFATGCGMARYSSGIFFRAKDPDWVYYVMKLQTFLQPLQPGTYSEH